MVHPALTRHDVELHEGLGISIDILTEQQVRRVVDREAREALGLNGRPGRCDGVLYPYLTPASPASNPSSPSRLPRTRERAPTKNKYLSGYGNRRHLYLAATDAILADINVPVVCVEAGNRHSRSPPAARRCQRRVVPIGLGGCWNWQGLIGHTTDQDGARVDEVGPLPDLGSLAGPAATPSSCLTPT